MSALQKEFKQFHDNIKLGTYEENETLRKKRDTLIDDLRESLKDEKIPGTQKPLTFTKVDQGSYAMNTGIKPKNDDYDIDVGVIFDITNDEYDSNKLKQLVRDKLNNRYNRTVDFNRPCITVPYASGYHVDLPIYSKNNDDLHIAWGKEFSSKNRCWYKSEPKKLNQWVKDVSPISEERKQFRRCVKALKKWKLKHFTSNGNSAPPSIGLTIQARNAFVYNADNDLKALISITKEIKRAFVLVWDDESNTTKRKVEVKLPVEPKKDVYYKMTLKQLNNYYDKVEALLESLEASLIDTSDHETSKVLRQIFGDDFPLVEDSKPTKTAPYVTTGHNA
ncbi:MAG: hypothetical protein ACI88H_003281 [Cocleimonas sp.]|jgi:hypothetical protein